MEVENKNVLSWQKKKISDDILLKICQMSHIYLIFCDKICIKTTLMFVMFKMYVKINLMQP